MNLEKIAKYLKYTSYILTIIVAILLFFGASDIMNLISFLVNSLSLTIIHKTLLESNR